jgi:hypothetical protein
MTCGINLKTIKTPARGKYYYYLVTLRYCKHLQCFSLENYVKAIYSSKKWKCIICKVRCYDFYVDSYFLEILKSFTENKIKIIEISFN